MWRATALTLIALGTAGCIYPAHDLERLYCDDRGACASGYACLAGRCIAVGSDAGLTIADRASNQDTAAADRQPLDTTARDLRRDAAQLPDVGPQPDRPLVDVAAHDLTAGDRTAGDRPARDQSAGDQLPAEREPSDRSTPDAATCVQRSPQFDGVDDYIEVADSSALDQPGHMTIEAWIKPLTVDTTTLAHIVAHESAGSFLGYQLIVSNGRPTFEYGDGSNWISAGASDNLQPGVWYHLAGVRDQNGASLYVNGGHTVFVPAANSIADYPGPLSIGAVSGGSLPFDGIIDEVRLSSADRYTGDFPPPSAPLENDADTVALWHLNDGSGQVASDTTGGHPGQLGASTDADSRDPIWVETTCIADRLR